MILTLHLVPDHNLRKTLLILSPLQDTNLGNNIQKTTFIIFNLHNLRTFQHIRNLSAV